MNTRKRPAKDHKQNSNKKPRAPRNDDTATDVWEASGIIAQLEKALQSEGKSSGAAAMKKYMRGKFDFFGLKSARRRELCKEVLGVKEKVIQNAEVRKFVLMLWGRRQRELQYFAMDFLEKHKKKLCQDVKEFDENMEFFKTLIVTKSWWDTVDMLASKLVGYLVQTHPDEGVSVMEAWVHSEDMWLRRTAILHQLSFKADTNSDLLYRFCLARCSEQEFFICKAIGWALRQYAHTEPNKVKVFLQENKSSLSKLSYNEASKHLNMKKK